VGPSGAGDSFKYPWGIEVDARANVYVANTNNHRVLMCRDYGALVSEWGGPGEARLCMRRP